MPKVTVTDEILSMIKDNLELKSESDGIEVYYLPKKTTDKIFKKHYGIDKETLNKVRECESVITNSMMIAAADKIIENNLDRCIIRGDIGGLRQVVTVIKEKETRNPKDGSKIRTPVFKIASVKSTWIDKTIVAQLKEKIKEKYE